MKSIQSRLSFYAVTLLVLLISILGYTYFYAKKVILDETNSGISNTANVITTILRLEEDELNHYVDIVRDDVRIKEYAFTIVKVGTDSEPLNAVFERHFGWLPISRKIVLTKDGDILLGKQHTELGKTLSKHIKNSKRKVFYARSDQGLEMINWGKLQYEGSELGIVAFTRILSRKWLKKFHGDTGGEYMFIVDSDTIRLSTLPNSEGQPFKVNNEQVSIISGQNYRVRPIIMDDRSSLGSTIWYGVSEKALLNKLKDHSRLALVLLISGTVTIVLMTIIFFRKFNRPLKELLRITEDVKKGSLPELKKTSEFNEIDLLSNQFAEMLNALRVKQQEIDKVHRDLEASATTDMLTQLYNRRHLQELFPRILRQSQRDHLVLTGMILDIDHFKQINDKHGHLAGDDCLVQFAELLTNYSRANDYVFRLGGEEFLILSLNKTENGGVLLAEKIREKVELQDFNIGSNILKLTTSIGVSNCSTELNPNEALIKILHDSDAALYEAKTGGRNRVIVQGPDCPLPDKAANIELPG